MHTTYNTVASAKISVARGNTAQHHGRIRRDSETIYSQHFARGCKTLVKPIFYCPSLAGLFEDLSN